MKIVCACGGPADLYFAISTKLRDAGDASAEIQFEHLRKGGSDASVFGYQVELCHP
jgi:hypothetical protein